MTYKERSPSEALTAQPAKMMISGTPLHSPDRMVSIINVVGRVTSSWGQTLRFITVVIAVGLTLRVLTGRIPWEYAATLVELGR